MVICQNFGCSWAAYINSRPKIQFDFHTGLNCATHVIIVPYLLLHWVCHPFNGGRTFAIIAPTLVTIVVSARAFIATPKYSNGRSIFIISSTGSTVIQYLSDYPLLYMRGLVHKDSIVFHYIKQAIFSPSASMAIIFAYFVSIRSRLFDKSQATIDEDYEVDTLDDRIVEVLERRCQGSHLVFILGKASRRDEPTCG